MGNRSRYAPKHCGPRHHPIHVWGPRALFVAGLLLMMLVAPLVSR